MEKIKNICRDLGRAFTIGLLSGGAAAAVLLLGGFLFGGFTFRAALEAVKDGLLLIAALLLPARAALPEGYEERADKRARFASTIAASFYYKDDEGEDYSISLTYTYMQDDTRWHYPADPERYVYRPVAVNGHEGMLGIYREENGSERCNSIIWMDEETNFQFQISFAWEELQLTENELIAMAESVQMQES